MQLGSTNWWPPWSSVSVLRALAVGLAGAIANTFAIRLAKLIGIQPGTGGLSEMTLAQGNLLLEAIGLQFRFPSRFGPVEQEVFHTAMGLLAAMFAAKVDRLAVPLGAAGGRLIDVHAANGINCHEKRTFPRRLCDRGRRSALPAQNGAGDALSVSLPAGPEREHWLATLSTAACKRVKPNSRRKLFPPRAGSEPRLSGFRTSCRAIRSTPSPHHSSRVWWRSSSSSLQQPWWSRSTPSPPCSRPNLRCNTSGPQRSNPCSRHSTSVPSRSSRVERPLHNRRSSLCNRRVWPSSSPWAFRRRRRFP